MFISVVTWFSRFAKFKFMDQVWQVVRNRKIATYQPTCDIHTCTHTVTHKKTCTCHCYLEMESHVIDNNKLVSQKSEQKKTILIRAS